MERLAFILSLAIVWPAAAAAQDVVAEAVPQPPVVVIADETADAIALPEPEPPAPEQRPETEQQLRPETEQRPGVIMIVVERAPQPVEIAPTTQVVEVVEPEPEPFTPGAFSLGLSGLVGTHEARDHQLAPTWTSGIDVGLRLTSLVTIGVRRITVGAIRDGFAWAFGGSPYVELAWCFAERFEPYVQLGAAVQGRTGLASSVGVAPFTGGGMRFYLSSFFSLAVEGAAHVPVTENVLLGHELFPFGSVVLQGGLAFTFHIG